MAEQRPSQSIALFGTDESDDKGRVLRAGSLSAEFQNGQLRYIRAGGTEVMRAVAFLVRDESWGTYNTEISNLRIEEGEDKFHVSYQGLCADGAVIYQADISAKASELEFAASLTATRNFRTNRTGFVILHPLEGCAGCPLEVEHADGRIEHARFPDKISPYQPFFAIRALKHEFAPRAFLVARLEGDTFEMEDQRNWSDASFKTYVRPIGLPWPYEIAAGNELKQKVSLHIEGRMPAQPSSANNGPIRISIGGNAGKIPKIGVEIPAKDADASRKNLNLIEALAPRLVVGEVLRPLGHGRRELALYRDIADACNAELTIEAALPCRDEPMQEAAELAAECSAADAKVDSLTLWAAADLKGVLPGSAWPLQPPLEAIRWAAFTAFPHARIGGGAHGFFTELNRRRPLVHFLDYVSFTTTPIVHAADDRSVMETLEAMPTIAQSAAAIVGEKAWRVGPSSIGARDNPYGTGATPNLKSARVCMAENDQRQRGLFGAAWTVGYLAALATSGAEAIVLGTAVGARGAIYRHSAEPQPWFDCAAGQRVYPLFHVIKAAASASGRQVLATSSSAPRRVAAIAWEDANATKLLLANLTPEVEHVAFDDAFRRRATCQMLDEAAFSTASAESNWALHPGKALAEDRINLPPYAVAFISRIGA
jgi:hypothetical protein